MKLSLPTKLTLGKKPQNDSSEPKEEIKDNETKYNPTEVKLMVIAIEDLHKNRFKNGWFTLLKFCEKVEKKPAILEELKQFSQETEIEKPEWVEPVIIFNKIEPAKRPDSAKKKGPLQKMNLKIGVEDDNPAKEQNAPNQPQNAVQQSQSQAEAPKKIPPPSIGLQLTLPTKKPQKSPQKVVKAKLNLQIGAKGNQEVENHSGQDQQKGTESSFKDREQKLEAVKLMFTILKDAELYETSLAFDTYRDNVEFLRLRELEESILAEPIVRVSKEQAAQNLFTKLDSLYNRSVSQYFRNVIDFMQTQTTQSLLEELKSSLQVTERQNKQFNQNLNRPISQQIKVKNDQPQPLIKTQEVINKVSEVQNLQDQALCLISSSQQQLTGQELNSFNGPKMQKIQLQEWITEPGRLSDRLKGTMKLIGIFERHAFIDKRILRRMRIWQSARLEDKIGALLQSLNHQDDKYKEKQINLLNLIFKARLKSCFQLWLTVSKQKSLPIRRDKQGHFMQNIGPSDCNKSRLSRSTHNSGTINMFLSPEMQMQQNLGQASGAFHGNQIISQHNSQIPQIKKIQSTQDNLQQRNLLQQSHPENARQAANQNLLNQTQIETQTPLLPLQQDRFSVQFPLSTGSGAGPLLVNNNSVHQQYKLQQKIARQQQIQLKKGGSISQSNTNTNQRSQSRKRGNQTPNRKKTPLGQKKSQKKMANHNVAANQDSVLSGSNMSILAQVRGEKDRAENRSNRTNSTLRGAASGQQSRTANGQTEEPSLLITNQNLNQQLALANQNQHHIVDQKSVTSTMIMNQQNQMDQSQGAGGEELLGNSISASNKQGTCSGAVGGFGGKTTTNKRQFESLLKILGSDSAVNQHRADASPQPLLSQQYKSSNSKLEMLREHFQQKVNQKRRLNSGNLGQVGEDYDSENIPINHTLGWQNAKFSSSNQQKLLVSEPQTQAIVNLHRILVCKGKERLALKDSVSVLKFFLERVNQRLNQKSHNETSSLGWSQSQNTTSLEGAAGPQSSIQQDLTPQEEILVQQASDRVQKISFDQWVLFTHWKVRQNVKKNIAISKLFGSVHNIRFDRYFCAMNRLRRYVYYLRSETRVKFHPMSNFRLLVEKMTKICINLQSMRIKARYAMVQKRFLKWWLVTKTLNVREQLQNQAQYSSYMMSGQNMTHRNQLSQRSAHMQDPKRQALIKNQSKSQGLRTICKFLINPRKARQKVRTYQSFQKWKSKCSKYHNALKRKLKGIIKQKIDKQMRFSFFKWYRNAFYAKDSPSINQHADSREECQIEESLIKNYSMLAQELYQNVEKKSVILKENALTRTLRYLLVKHHNLAVPSSKQKIRYFRRWIQQISQAKSNLQTNSLAIRERQLQQFEIVKEEKEELQRKVAEQNEINEDLQGQLGQIVSQNACKNCKQKQMQLFLGRRNGEMSQSRLRDEGLDNAESNWGVGVAGNGGASEVWDLESSQASNHFENVGRFITDENLAPTSLLVAADPTTLNKEGGQDSLLDLDIPKSLEPPRQSNSQKKQRAQTAAALDAKRASIKSISQHMVVLQNHNGDGQQNGYSQVAEVEVQNEELKMELNFVQEKVQAKYEEMDSEKERYLQMIQNLTDRKNELLKAL